MAAIRGRAQRFDGGGGGGDASSQVCAPKPVSMKNWPGAEPSLQGQDRQLHGHTLTDNRHGMVVNAMVPRADGFAEREAAKAMIRVARTHADLGRHPSVESVGREPQTRLITGKTGMASDAEIRRQCAGGLRRAWYLSSVLGVVTQDTCELVDNRQRPALAKHLTRPEIA
jgi:hypothetical protein